MACNYGILDNGRIVIDPAGKQIHGSKHTEGNHIISIPTIDRLSGNGTWDFRRTTVVDDVKVYSVNDDELEYSILVDGVEVDYRKSDKSSVITNSLAIIDKKYGSYYSFGLKEDPTVVIVSKDGRKPAYVRYNAMNVWMIKCGLEGLVFI